jgi:alkaline phosphatase
METTPDSVMITPRRQRLAACALLLAAAGHAAAGASPEAPAVPAGPRQVILIIGDGMDEQQITIARNYLKGARGRLLMDQMPLRAAVQVLTVEDRAGAVPVYVADSANTATSMATGAVTSRGRIATSAGDDEDLPTIVELAQAAGYRTGIVTTASVTDATPAAFAAHIGSRECQNPGQMVDVRYFGIPVADCSADLVANGGRGSIARQLAESGLDLLLGGGRKHFAPVVEGGTLSVEAHAQAHGFRLISTAAELDAAGGKQRLLGLFSPDTMPVRLRGEGGREAESPRPGLLGRLQPHRGEASLPAPMACEDNPAFDDVPTLRQMTEAALAHLSRGNERGFFLMVESASIDKETHERRPCGAIGEMAQLEEALASALAFAGSHPRTLVLVTSDHAQAAQLLPRQSLYAKYPGATYTPGRLARLTTPEGALLVVNYATSRFIKEEHTGAGVPLFANSEGAGRVPPFLQQPQIFSVVRDYLALP